MKIVQVKSAVRPEFDTTRIYPYNDQGDEVPAWAGNVEVTPDCLITVNIETSRLGMEHAEQLAQAILKAVEIARGDCHAQPRMKSGKSSE